MDGTDPAPVVEIRLEGMILTSLAVLLGLGQSHGLVDQETVYFLGGQDNPFLGQYILAHHDAEYDYAEGAGDFLHGSAPCKGWMLP